MLPLLTTAARKATTSSTITRQTLGGFIHHPYHPTTTTTTTFTRDIRTKAGPFERLAKLFSVVEEEVDPGEVEGTSLRIVKYPDPRLRAQNEEIEEFTPEIQKLAKDMFKVMYAANGVGLAAPQVGINKRLMVFNAGEYEEGQGLEAIVVVIVVVVVIEAVDDDDHDDDE